MPPSPSTHPVPHSGPDDEAAIRVFEALQRYQDAVRELWKAAQSCLGLGETDLAAVSMLIESQRLGVEVAPKDLSRRLGISSASTTVLIDRLEARDWLHRDPHPRDRRGVLVTASASAAERFAALTSPVRRALLDAAAARPDRELAATERVLSALAQEAEAALERIGEAPNAG